MKENIYDNNRFFDKYSHFPRSVAGLSAAGEWHELKKMLPDFQGKAVLDIGCGFGWHCIYAAERGADTVIGTDISTKMLAGARERTHLANI
ncbi:bifunctional 2-polyprenyl-6-hydroxyphenol methylase/3-demethylubiquinol 3-O-methyltransferase UbiG, partial [Enterococcus sp. 5B7_DIV0075]